MVEDVVQQGGEQQPVVRDRDFRRLYADYALASYLDHGLEITLLAASGDMSSLTTTNGRAEVEGRTVLAEMARIRMAAPGAATLAMNIFLALVDGDHMSLEAFDERIADLRSNFVAPIIDGK